MHSHQLHPLTAIHAAVHRISPARPLSDPQCLPQHSSCPHIPIRLRFLRSRSDAFAQRQKWQRGRSTFVEDYEPAQPRAVCASDAQSLHPFLLIAIRNHIRPVQLRQTLLTSSAPHGEKDSRSRSVWRRSRRCPNPLFDSSTSPATCPRAHGHRSEGV